MQIFQCLFGFSVLISVPVFAAGPSKLDCSVSYSGSEDGFYNYPLHSIRSKLLELKNEVIEGTVSDDLVSFEVKMNKRFEVSIIFTNSATKGHAASVGFLPSRAPATGEGSVKVALLLPMAGEKFKYRQAETELTEEVYGVNLTCAATY